MPTRITLSPCGTLRPTPTTQLYRGPKGRGGQTDCRALSGSRARLSRVPISCPWHGFHAWDMDFLLGAWTSCLEHGFHAWGMDFKPGAWTSCLEHGLHAWRIDFMPGAWISCLGHGFHAWSMDFMPGAWISCLGHRFHAWGMDLMPGYITSKYCKNIIAISS